MLLSTEMDHQTSTEDGAPQSSPQPKPSGGFFNNIITGNESPTDDYDIDIPIDVPHHREARSSSSSVTYPVLENLSRPATRSRIVADTLSAWTFLSVEMRRRREQLWGTIWRPILQVKGKRIVEVWLAFEEEKTAWYTIAVDGAVDKVDEKRLNKLRDDYVKQYESAEEVLLFPTEVVGSALAFLDRKPPLEVIRMWGVVSNPVSDYLTADFRCAICEKIRKLKYLHARILLKCMPWEHRRCQALGLRCADGVTQKAYHPTLRVLQHFVEEVGDRVDEQQGEQDDYRSLGLSDPQEHRNDNILKGSHDRAATSGGNTLAMLRAMGKQGVSVKPYDGTGGGIALKVWGESLRRHFRMFDIVDEVDQVTVGTCFLEGKAKD